MSQFGQKIIFKQVFAHHGRVQVPMIQRDYAQGRESEAEVRELFLDALHGALSLPPDDPLLPLNLDFIYGSVEGEGESRFLPLDGQQRLTTMFLLHWYLAWREYRWEEFLAFLCPNGKSLFSYTVRPSSEEFYDALVIFQPDQPPDDIEYVSRLVTNQSWYFRNWRLDPTIQSSLKMLDAIHVRFRDSSGLYERITDAERPAITFQLMDLENFGLSDDLYIKMNARGKPLTAFETFKARYEQELMKQFVGEMLSIGDESLSVAEFFARRMDTAWADFFWAHRNTDTNLYDEAVMNLFRTVALVSRDPEDASYLENINLLRNRRAKSSYARFHNQGWLDRNFSEIVILLLEAWSKGETDFAPQLPDTRYFDERSLFGKAVKEPTDLGLMEIVQFAGYVLYMREHSDCSDSRSFQEWMRVVFNLSTNTSYDRPADMQRSILGLLNIAQHSGNVLQFLAATERPTAGFSPQQISEEKLKAQLILADVGWRALIDRAEAHGYFKGQIEFLLDFCGALRECKKAYPNDWEATAHRSLQGEFETYLEKAEAMFAAHGIVNLGQYRWERALLSVGDYFLPSGRQNISFLTNPPAEQASWKRLLRGTGQNVPEARSLLQKLLDRLNIEGALDPQLDKIIERTEGVEPWRGALIETAEAFKYCEKRAIRFINENTVYLLRKSRMNGAHAELFTYSLFHNTLLPMASNGGLEPLRLSEHYYSVIGADSEPGIRLVWSSNGHSVTFDVEWNGHLFIICVQSNSLEELPDVKCALCEKTGFAEEESILVRKTSSTDFLDVLFELRQALSAITMKPPTDLIPE